MRRWIMCVAPAIACALMASCSSSTADSVPIQPDSGDEAPPPPPPTSDAGRDADAKVSDGGRPNALAVECAGDPCYVAVSGNGGRHMCGLLRDGTVRCWGRDTLDPPAPGGVGDGALGRGVAVSTIEGATAAPVAGLPPATENAVTQISVGPNLGTCARTADGAVYCWGRNEKGQLGRPSTEVALPVPTRIEGLPPVREVKLGHNLGCAVASEDGVLYCWGTLLERGGWPPNYFDWSAYGLDGGAASEVPPTRMAGMGTRLVSFAVATGGSPAADTIIGLREDHVLTNVGVYVAGFNSLYPPWPAPVEQPFVTAIWPYAYLTDDFELWHWVPFDGDSKPGRVIIQSPERIVDVKMSAYSEALGGEERQVVQYGALFETGRLYRWGTNTAGGLGVPPSQQPKAEYPMEVTQLGRQVVSFATTIGAACASLVDGTVRCWGENAFGELGRGTVDLAPHPEPEALR